MRGIGKTVLLLQLSKKYENSIYISLDSIDEKFSLFDTIKELNTKYSIDYFFLDEIHNYINWQKELKTIYDFLNVKIVFTSSVALEIIESKYDLSRRVAVIKMQPFSFSEYIYFKYNKIMKSLHFENLFDIDTKEYNKYVAYFDEYMSGFSVPASLQSPSTIIIPNILEKIIERDLVALKKLDLQDIQNIRLTLKYIANNRVDVVGFSNISKNIGIHINKVKQYLELLEKTFVLQIIYPYSKNVMKEPKILFNVPFRSVLYNNINKDDLVGAIREEFFVFHLNNLELNIKYLKNDRGEKMPDYIITYKNRKIIFEIGGPGKTKKQLNACKEIPCCEKYLLQQPFENELGAHPLILLGFVKTGEKK